MKKITTLFSFIIFLSLVADAQTYNDGKWYSLYAPDEVTRGALDAAGDKSWEYDVFAPTTGVFTFDWKKTGQFVGYPGLDISAYQSSDGGSNYTEICHISSPVTQKQEEYITSGEQTVEKNTNKLKMTIEGGTLSRHYSNLQIPLAKHILFDSGEYGTTADKSNDFGTFTWGETSEPYHVSLRSFYVNGDITVTSDIPDVFRIGSTDNTNGLTYEVGVNACASKNGNGAAGGSKLGKISNYDFDIYFCPQEGKDYNGVVTITDGTNSLTINVSGVGLKKSQNISWEQEDGTYLSNVSLTAAVASSGLDIAYTFEPEGIIADDGGSLKITGTGDVTVTAKQTGDTRYHAAEAVSKSFTIHPAVTYGTAEGSVCPDGGYEFIGNTYGKGTHEVKIANVWGGDSIITLTINENPTYLLPEEMTMYENHAKTWHGKDLSKLGVGEQTIYDSLVSINGCDSVYKLTLTVMEKPTNGTQYTKQICAGDSYSDDNFTDISEAKDYSTTLTNYLGGDSIVTLTLTVNPTYSIPEEMTMYENQAKTWHGKDLSKLGVGEQTIYDSLVSINGCDSVYILTLTVMEKPTNGTQYTKQICAGDSYSDDNFTDISEAKDYSTTLTNYLGGDSIVTLTLTVNPTYSIPEEMTMYENQAKTWHGKDLSKLGVGEQTIYDSLVSINGCDSVHILTLTILDKPENSYEYTAYICNGDNYSDDNFTDLNEAKDYSVTLTNYLGGDSVVILTLAYYPTYFFQEDKVIYVGAEGEWHGYNLAEQPVGFHTLMDENSTYNGCDSTYMLSLTVIERPTSSYNYEAATCANEPYSDENFSELTEAKTYTTILTNYLGADSIITFTLHIIPILNGEEETEVTYGSDEWIAKAQGKDAGEYESTATEISSLGCDSVTTYKLIVNQATQEIIWIPDTTILTVGETLNLNAYTTSGLAVSYAISDENLTEITDNMLTATASGTVIVSLTQEGNTNYLAAETVNVKITILDVTDLHDIIASDRQAAKQLRNGTMYIIKGEAVYTADGMRTK